MAVIIKGGPWLASVFLTLLGGIAAAQDDELKTPVGEEQADEVVEEIIVVGSRLHRRDFSAPSPVTTVDRESLDATGQRTLESALSQLPQFTPSFDRTANNPGNGRAWVDLRGLGAKRTLVMLNGRRLSPSGIGTAVDLNNLPQALIENVEIVTGGASAVYGSDAVSGVVNFNIRSDFEGFGLDFSTYATEQGDSNINDLNVVYGHNFADGRGNLTLYGGYYDREETYADKRAFTSTPLLDGTWDGELYEGGSPVTPSGSMWFPPVDWGNGYANTVFDADGSPREFIDPDDLYNYAPWNFLQIPLRRYHGGALFNYDIGEGREVYVEASYSLSQVDRVLAPVPARSRLVVNFDNPVLHPDTAQLFANALIPAGDNVGWGFFVRRFEELGPRILPNESTYSRVLVGLRGEAWSDWEFDAWLTYTRNDETDEVLNDGSLSRWQQGLLVDSATGQCYDTSNGCVPVDMFGPGNLTAEAVDFLRLRPLVDVTDREQWLASAFVRGSVFDTWAGEAEAVIGLEWRTDDGSYAVDPYIVSGDSMAVPNYSDSNVIGGESALDVYAEMLVPLADGAFLTDYLALEVGARYARYDHAEPQETWKVGIEWAPFDDLRLRSMLQRSARAPNLREAFQSQIIVEGEFVGDDPRDDPCSAASNPVENGNLEKCIATGLPEDQVGIFEASRSPTLFISGGNPDLASEKADTLTVGLVYSPEALPGLQLSIDYFEIEIDGEIGSLAAIDACFDPANADNVFCDLIIRDPLSFNVSEIREFNINRGTMRTSGIDTLLSYTHGLSVLGQDADLSIDVTWSHLRELANQETPFSSSVDCSNTFGWPCTNRFDGMTWPTDRVTTRLRYDTGRFASQLNWRWIDKTRNGAYIGAPLIGIPVSELDLAVPDVEAKNYFDLSLAYSFGDHVTIGLTIANLADEDPPLMADWVWDKNTDTRMYDIFGRSYTLSLSMIY
jgi:iron complex outermembrane receptor protein